MNWLHLPLPPLVNGARLDFRRAAAEYLGLLNGIVLAAAVLLGCRLMWFLVVHWSMACGYPLRRA